VSEARVLIVDDQPETTASGLAANLDREGVFAEAIEPQEIDERRLLRADLVLVDYKLDEWEVASGVGEVARSPQDGLALAAVLASRLRHDERVHGVALYSAELHMLVQDFSSAVTEHAAARINGIDWAFQKDRVQSLPPTSKRVAQFAEAVQHLSGAWNSDTEGLGPLEQFLNLPDAPWGRVAIRDVLAAQPPIHQFAESSRGVTVLRWLAQRILPYPTFLLDRSQLAIACGATPASLMEVDVESLDAAFDQALYRGSLDDFLGPRWWRAGIRRKIREWTDSTQASQFAVEQLGSAIGHKLTPMDPISSVLGMDKSLQEVAGLIARERAMRVRPDDWPIFAEPAWVDEELVRANTGLQAYVDPADLSRLDATP
jgi:hypothetical protein